MMPYTEDHLVQRTTAEFLEETLGWESVYAYNNEDFGPDSLLGRASDTEVVLTRYLRPKLEAFNPGLPTEAYESAVRQLLEYSTSQSLLQINREKDALLRDGVEVSFQNEKGQRETSTLRVFDFDTPENNHFLVVRELKVWNAPYRRRPDLMGFVNGIPLIFVEAKNTIRDVQSAYDDNFSDYKDAVPHLFHHNALVVLTNGIEAKIGSLSSPYGHFHEWKRLEEEDPGVVDLETLLRGVFSIKNLLDLFENFIVFDDSRGKVSKIVARNHQYLGVRRAVQSVRERKERNGKLGVFWHTQGSGKSYSMVFFTRMIHRKLDARYTFLVVTDRTDLDGQIYKTFAGCGVVNNDRDPCRAASGDHLQELLGKQKKVVFSLIHKFNQDVDPDEPYSTRDDIIVISDEAHRTQYGRLALNMRNALPGASYIGFTGTPLFKGDEPTRQLFGDYVSTYDFQRAVDDNATVPLFYDARGEKLKITTSDLNERIAAKLEELDPEDADVSERLQRELGRDYHIITASSRLEPIARDFVKHYANAWETGKTMFICLDKITCARMHALITAEWEEHIGKLERGLRRIEDDQENKHRERQIAWMRETMMAMVVSEEQGEVDAFRKWDIDIRPHRTLIKNGFETDDGKRIDVDTAFKKPEHPFRVAIVCAMWLTGFDVPSLSTLYLDKPMRAHTLMQAIARANRVYEGKENGLIVDYCGILKNLREALATFGKSPDIGRGGEGIVIDPVAPAEELLEQLEEAIEFVRAFLTKGGCDLNAIIEQTGFALNKAIRDAKEVVNETDESRQRFGIMARAVLQKFKACINTRGINRYTHEHDAIAHLYRSLERDVAKADIADIIRELHDIVNEAVETHQSAEPHREESLYDISKIDFELLQREFRRSESKNTTVQSLKHAIEQRLDRMMQRNPLRMDFQLRFEEIVAAYNHEKERVTIEQTFEELMRLVAELDEEEQRAVVEGLTEESLAIYDLLAKTELSKKEVNRVKDVAEHLIALIKAELAKLDRWREKEATRDYVSTTIYNFLYDDATGLPLGAYTPDEVRERSSKVYQHVFRIYDAAERSVYASAA